MPLISAPRLGAPSVCPGPRPGEGARSSSGCCRGVPVSCVSGRLTSKAASAALASRKNVVTSPASARDSTGWLVADERKNRLPQPNFIVFFERVLANPLAVDRGAVGAAFVMHDILAVGGAVDGGMQARYREILEEDIAIAAAPDGQAVATDLVDAAGILACPDDDGAGSHTTGRLALAWVGFVAVGHRCWWRVIASAALRRGAPGALAAIGGGVAPAIRAGRRRGHTPGVGGGCAGTSGNAPGILRGGWASGGDAPGILRGGRASGGCSPPGSGGLFDDGRRAAPLVAR